MKTAYSIVIYERNNDGGVWKSLSKSTEGTEDTWKSETIKDLYSRYSNRDQKMSIYLVTDWNPLEREMETMRTLDEIEGISDEEKKNIITTTTWDYLELR